MGKSLVGIEHKDPLKDCPEESLEDVARLKRVLQLAFNLILIETELIKIWRVEYHDFFKGR